MGLPGLAGADHIGITVPDLEAATRFFVDVIGWGTVTFEVGALSRGTMTGCNNTSEWIRGQTETELRMLKCANGPSIEIVLNMRLRIKRKQFQRTATSAAHHVGFYVTDLDAAIAHLRRNGR